MKKNWNFLSQAHLFKKDIQVEKVLVEYDGPQIAVFHDPTEIPKLFGVAVDEEVGMIRWILIKISPTELTALLNGLVFLRDVFLKESCYIVDFNEEMEVVASWEIANECLEDSHLPKPRVPLYLIPIASPLIQEGRAIKLDGRLFKEHSIGFRQLSDLFGTIQRLWERIAESEILKKGMNQVMPDIKSISSLNLAATQMGSLELRVEASNDDLFDLVAKHFSEILTASNDLDLLKERLNRLGTRTKSAYTDFLGVIHLSGLEFLFMDQKSPAFVSPGMAQNIRRTISEHKNQFKSSFISTGYFYAYRNKKSTHTFEFFDEQRGESFKGSVDPQVWKYYTDIRISPSHRYKVKITEVDIQKGGIIESKSYRLKVVDPVIQSDG